MQRVVSVGACICRQLANAQPGGAARYVITMQVMVDQDLYKPIQGPSDLEPAGAAFHQISLQLTAWQAAHCILQTPSES